MNSSAYVFLSLIVKHEADRGSAQSVHLQSRKTVTRRTTHSNRHNYIAVAYDASSYLRTMKDPSRSRPNRIDLTGSLIHSIGSISANRTLFNHGALHPLHIRYRNAPRIGKDQALESL